MPFTAKQASKLTGASPKQLFYWEKIGLISPTFEVPVKRGSSKRYSLIDLIQIKVIEQMRSQGISLQKIGKSLKYIKKHIRSKKRPFAELKFITDGHSIFIDTEDRIIDTVKEGQYVFSLDIGDIVEKLNQDIKELFKEKWVSLKVDGEEYQVFLQPEFDTGRFKAHWQGIKVIKVQGETEDDALRAMTAAIRRFNKGW